MFKHVLTLKCNRKCEYCIMKNVPSRVGKEATICEIEKFYQSISQSETTIMLTGGEPTLYKGFGAVVAVAHKYFERVFVTSQNPRILGEEYPGLDAITFSIHDRNIPTVHVSVPVYASILEDNYFEGMESVLRDRGYSGLTVNEDQRGDSTTFDRLVQHLRLVKFLSIKINRKGNCQDSRIIFPNLQETRNFLGEYL